MNIHKIQQKELTGRIVFLGEKSGIISSDQHYNFDLKFCFFNVKQNDDVIFIIDSKGSISAIRKLYTNSCGIKFYSRIIKSHIHVDLENFLPIIIEQISNSNENYIEKEFAFPNVIGKSDCVRTDEFDKIVYAKRKGREGNTRFVLNRYPEDCKTIFAAFKKIGNKYSIMTIFIGKKAGREPWDKNATKSDEIFWKNHALIFNEDLVETNSILEAPITQVG